MAIRLKQEGTDDFVLIERGEDVGGTWWANSYPGAQCDVPSNLYSFSFAPNPDWTRAYPLRDEIQAYLRDCAERDGVVPHVRLGCELLGATWVAGEQRWELETSQGPIAARVLVAAPGLLSEPFEPVDTRPGALRGQRLPHSALGSRRRPDRQARGCDRDGRLRGAGGAGNPAARWQAHALPAHAAVGGAARGPRSDAADARGLPAPAGSPAALARLHLLARRASACPGDDARSPLSQAGRVDREAQAAPRGSRPGPAAATDAQLPARLQATRLLERVVSGAPGAERRHRELRHPRGARALDRGWGRHRARDRHADPRDRLHARRAADRGADPRTRRPFARGGLGRQPAGVPGHDRHRLPEPALPLRPEREPGPHVDRLHARVSAGLRHRRAPDDAPPRRGRVRGASGGPGRLQRGAPRAARGHRLEQRLRQLVHRPQRAQLDHVARLHLRVPPPHAPLRHRRPTGSRLRRGPRVSPCPAGPPAARPSASAVPAA